MHHRQAAPVQGKTLSPSSGNHLSRRGLDKLARGSFEVFGCHTLDPQCPADRSTASGLRQAFRSEVQVCPSTQLPLPYIRNQAVVRPHQPQQLGLVGLLSTAQTGADRLAHVSSLASRLRVRILKRCGPLCREPSQDGRRSRTRLSSSRQASQDGRRGRTWHSSLR